MKVYELIRELAKCDPNKDVEGSMKNKDNIPESYSVKRVRDSGLLDTVWVEFEPHAYKKQRAVKNSSKTAPEKMTRKQFFYRMVRDNWNEEFQGVARHVCGRMPYYVLADVDIFLEAFSKLSDKEQIYYIEHMAEYEGSFHQLSEPHRHQLSCINEDNYNKSAKYLVTVMFKWHNTEAPSDDHITEQKFISDYYIDSTEDKTVKEIVKNVWKCCSGHYENEPPRKYRNGLEFRYSSWCWCYIAVKSEPLLIETDE
jgi:hypothetical protein